MGWFDEQIRNRKTYDQEKFEESILRMASAVVGTRDAGILTDERIITKDAIDDILKYYHYKPVDIPERIKDPDEQLVYALRPHGLMYRVVELTEGWYRDCFGPLICHRVEDHMPVAVFPSQFGGYWYTSETGSWVRINSKNAALFDHLAICFYRPLPLKAIGIPDLLLYMKDCLDVGDFALIGAFSLISIFAGLMLPRITKIMTGYIYESGNVTLLWGTAVFMIAAAFSVRLISAAESLASTRVETKTGICVESAIMMRLLSLPAPFFKKYSSGELSGRSQSVNELCTLLMGDVFSLGITSLTSLLYITQIFHFTPGLTLPAVIIILVTVAFSLLTTFMQMGISRQSMEYDVKENGITFALISGVQKIKLAGAEKRAFSRWAEAYTKTASLTYNPPLFIKLNSTIMVAVNLIGAAVLYYAAVATRVTPSEYIAFNVSYGMVMGAFTSLAGIAVSIAQIRPILEMAEPILKAEPEVSEGREILTRISGGIEISNVSFRYNENLPYIVKDLNLKIRPGEYVALVGRTGCGKSTLMRLLLGFETPEKGAIYYDGKDIKKLDLQSLRRKIGAVTQDGSLFQGDIFSNIVICAPQLTLDRAWEAAEMAGIADDIRAMPMGMNTVIGEGQGGVSGGQKQRLMIARAVAPKPRILMFDEATSALDNKTQRQVSEALDKLRCTRIVIAHRLSTIKNCDRILVLDEGKIRESGTYEELIQKGGFFTELVERQRLDRGDEPSAPEKGAEESAVEEGSIEENAPLSEEDLSAPAGACEDGEDDQEGCAEGGAYEDGEDDQEGCAEGGAYEDGEDDQEGCAEGGAYEDGEDDQESCAEGGAYEDDKDGEDPYERGEAH